MGGCGSPPWTPSWVLALKSLQCSGGGSCDSDCLEAPPHHAAVPGTAKNRCAPWIGLSPLPSLLLLAMFLGSSLAWWEFMCFRHQIPPWEPHCLGPPCQVAQAFTTRRQAGGIKGDRARSPPEAAVILCCLGLAGGHGNTSRTPSHTQLAHPALRGNC